MTDMLDIARSGLLAYRNALTVTSENIANVNTAGYVRRDVATLSAPGARATPFTAATGGQGVSVLDVRRAFDAIAADRLRATAGTRAAAEVHATGAAAIEDLMLPGEAGMDAALRGFFDAFETLGVDAAAPAARQAVLGSARTLAGAVSAVGAGLQDLRSDLSARAEGAVQRAADLLGDLAEVARRLGGASSAGRDEGAAFPLADRRDALLGELGEILPLSVATGPDGMPTVRLGGPAGMVLLQGDRTADLAVATQGILSLTVTPPGGSSTEVRLLARGELAGLSRAIGAVDMAIAEVDAFARGLAEAVNSVHRTGIDAAGRQGGDLFRIGGWSAVPAASNAGTVAVDLAPAAGTGVPMVLTFEAAAGEWVARDAGGAEIGRGQTRLELPGVTVDLSGAAADGHRIDIVPAYGRARDLALALDDPARLAAAPALAAAAAAGNTGTGRVTVGLAPAIPVPVALAPASTAADVAPGVLGVLPAGTGEVSLVSWGRPATTTLAFAAGADRLDVDVDGTVHSFSLAGIGSASALVTALSAGTLRSDGDATLSSLGLTVADAGGTITLSRPGSTTPAGAVLSGPGISVTGTETAGAAAGGTIQVITRDGRHIAGTPLSPTEAAALLTEANGFRAGAVYDSTPLTAGTGTGYRGTQAEIAAAPGIERLALAGTGMVTGAALPLAAAAARTITLTDAGSTVSVDLPQGASAATAAARLADALPGLSARAVTALELSDLPDGAMSLALQGSNTDPITVSATVAGGNGGALAQAVNALSGATGIRAELSPDGRRVLLVQDAGHDITLSALQPGGGGSLRVRPAAADGTTSGPGTMLAAGAVRQGGQVILTGARPFGANDGVALTGSAPGAGPVEVMPFAAGAGLRLRPGEVPAGADGGRVVTLDVGGVPAVATLASGTSAVDAAAALAASLRRGAPDATVTSAPLAALPPDGSVLAARLDGATYTVRMQGGVPVVTGPESGRLAAAFDGTNRLVLSAQGVTDGQGITILSGAAAFGLGPAQGTQVITGRMPDASALPVTLRVTVDGTAHDIDLTAGGVVAPPGFPGTADTVPGTGALRLTLPAQAALSIDPVAGSGFGGPGVAVRAEAEEVVLLGRGAALQAVVSVAGTAGQSLRLSDLPPEDLVVAMTGSGTLRMSGAVMAGAPVSGPGAVDLVVQDAAAGRVALRDSATGEVIATGNTDGQGGVTLGGLSLRLSGGAATGDVFRVLPAAAGSPDGAVAAAVARLRAADAATGALGLVDRLARVQTDAGVRTAAADRARDTAQAAEDAAGRAMAAIGAVDLDAEAARLVEFQQAYQASAQAVAVARDLFDTLLGLF